MYPETLVQPMRAELEKLGFESLRTPEEVDNALARRGTQMIVVNSVCGCAAGSARPGVALALQHPVRPDHLFTVFAGQDSAATVRARAAFTGVTPSSPSIALLRDGKLAWMLERRHIEGRDAAAVAALLTEAFDRYLGA